MVEGQNSIQCVHVRVAIPSVMEAEGPVRREPGPPNHLLVLLDHSFQAWTQEEIEIKDSWRRRRGRLIIILA